MDLFRLSDLYQGLVKSPEEVRQLHPTVCEAAATFLFHSIALSEK